jgi:predicted esterase
MELHRHEANRYRFMMKDRGSPGHWYDVLVDSSAALGQPGGGTVHHIAFRTASDRTQALWQKQLRQNGVPVTDVRDRKYFRSIYFNSSQGVLFEIATDPPGFTADESMDALGTALKLPDQYEAIRAAIENRLPPLHPASFQHVFKDAPKPAEDGRTVVTLHGTGGNEHDLVRFAEGVAATSAILSPRGRVLENGMPRFFKRLADNVFDEADVIRRAHELSDFLIEAAVRYGRKPAQMTALGYSNGANMAAAILLLRPEVFSSAVLLRPMLPLQKQSLPDLKGKAVLILRGAQDAVIPSGSTDQLVSSLQQTGAEVTTRTIAAGHEITRQDIDTMSDWLSERPKIGKKHFNAAYMPTSDDPQISAQ